MEKLYTIIVKPDCRHTYVSSSHNIAKEDIDNEIFRLWRVYWDGDEEGIPLFGIKEQTEYHKAQTSCRKCENIRMRARRSNAPLVSYQWKLVDIPLYFVFYQRAETVGKGGEEERYSICSDRNLRLQDIPEEYNERKLSIYSNHAFRIARQEKFAYNIPTYREEIFSFMDSFPSTRWMTVNEFSELIRRPDLAEVLTDQLVSHQ